LKQKGVMMLNHSKYQRTRNLRIRVVENSEQLIEKLDKLLLLVILPLSFAAIFNAFIKVLF
tara:strand:+ start:275 stop:457 length:183 start_codon:yes stop_codon:yes gene_type:complete